jgi:hypothetical protein
VTDALPTPKPDDEVEADREIARLATEVRRARGLRVAARRALHLARRYRAEEGPRGARETECVRQALAWRAAAARLRAERDPGPGLARASVPPGSASRRASGA